MKRTLIVLVVLAGLLVAADFGAAAYAESAVARQMRERLGLENDPAVRINGFPFLTQAVAGHYSSVDIRTPMIVVGGLRELEVRVRLEGVTAPLSDLVGSGPSTVQVEKVVGTVRIGPDDLERLIPGGMVEDLRIENLDAAALRRAAMQSGDTALAKISPDRAARLVGKYAVLGPAIEVSTIAVLRLVDGGQIVLEPRDLRVGGSSGVSLPPGARTTLRQLFTIRFDSDALPLEIIPETFKAVNGGLEISGTATDVVLGASTTSAG